MSSHPEVEAIRHALAMPFDPSEVKFKPAMVSGNRALAIPFVDARVVMERLDDVFGVGGWQTSYREAKDGVICTLQVMIGGEWVTHEDVGGQSEQPDEGDRLKAAFSDSLKRVAVQLGVGRYLYRQKPQWADYDPQKRQFLKQPTLPADALPKPSPAVQQPPEKPAVATPEPPADWVRAYDAKLAGEGLIARGELVAAIAGRIGGLETRSPSIYAEVREEAKKFEAIKVLARRIEHFNGHIRRTGKTWEQIRAAMKLPDILNTEDMTAKQWEVCLARLEKTPDAKAQKARAG